MIDNDFSYKYLHIVKFYADKQLTDLKVNIYEDQIIRNLTGKGLIDAEVLFRMLINEVKQHNKLIETKRTLLRNLRYDKDWLKSKLLHGLKIPHAKIKDTIKQFPELDHYDLYHKSILQN